jgi:DNA-binding transcriptional LysR family regulator
MVVAGEEALDALSEHSAQPVGALRITLPAFGLNSAIHRAIWSFAKQHPMVALSIKSSDRPVDLVREGFDLAIRVGKLADSTLKSRRIASFHRKLVASPEFLNRSGPIRDPDALISQDFVSLDMVPDTITLARDGENITFIPETYRIEVDTIIAGKAAVLAGLGIMSLPLNEIEGELNSGALVEVLPQWKLPTLGVFAVWPDAGQQKNLTRRIIEFLTAQPADLQLD